MYVWVDLRGDAGGQGRDGRAPWFGPYLRRRLALRFPENDFTSFLVADEEDMKTFFWKVFASFPATKISPAFSSRNFQRMAPGTIHSSTSTTKNPEGRSIERISRRWEIYCGIQRKKKLLKICLGVVDDELRIRLEKRKKKTDIFASISRMTFFFVYKSHVARRLEEQSTNPAPAARLPSQSTKQQRPARSRRTEGTKGDAVDDRRGSIGANPGESTVDEGRRRPHAWVVLAFAFHAPLSYPTTTTTPREREDLR